MQFTSIYKNGKPTHFFIKVDNMKEYYSFMQPYFLVTTYAHPRRGNILEMNTLFSCAVWAGRGRHGYGYSHSADIYGELIDIIKTIHKGRLSAEALAELASLPIHEDEVTLSEALMDELIKLNNGVLYNRC